MINLKPWQENFIDEVIRNLGLQHMYVQDFCLTHEDMYDYLAEAGYTHFNILSGASKAAIVFDDFPYVIKIPFFRTCEWNSYYNVYQALSWEVEDGCGVECPISGEYGVNYCQAEAEFCTMANFYGIGEMFATTEFYCTYLGACGDEWPIYIQEKVDEIECHSDRHTAPITREMREYVDYLQTSAGNTMRERTGKTRRYTFPPLAFTKALLDKYGEEKVRKLFEFCYIYNINDLHTSNVGYIIAPDEEVYPVLFDYSGFHRFN